MSWTELITKINPHLYQVEPSPSSSTSFSEEFSPKKSRTRDAVRPNFSSYPSKQTAPSSQTASTLQSSPIILDNKHNHRVNDALDLMSQCLHWDPTRRITAAEALKHPFLFEDDEVRCDDNGEAQSEFKEPDWQGYVDNGVDGVH